MTSIDPTRKDLHAMSDADLAKEAWFGSLEIDAIVKELASWGLRIRQSVDRYDHVVWTLKRQTGPLNAAASTPV